MTSLKWLAAAIGLPTLLFFALFAIGAMHWRGLIEQLNARLEEAARKSPPPALYDARELEGLPVPVQRYFRTVRWCANDHRHDHTRALTRPTKAKATASRWLLMWCRLAGAAQVAAALFALAAATSQADADQTNTQQGQGDGLWHLVIGRCGFSNGLLPVSKTPC